MRILVVSQTSWSSDNNGGNTLDNLFREVNAEFAHIYFSEGQPNTDICNLFYQVTDKMIIDHIVKRTKIGKIVHKDESKINNEIKIENSLKKYKNIYTIIARELLWKISDVLNKEMDEFITEFNPDVIYAPIYGNFIMLRIAALIKNKYKKPMISFISDDLYSYKKQSSKVENIYQYFLRKKLYDFFKLPDIIYTMTEEQKVEYQDIFNRELRLLKKSYYNLLPMNNIHKPIRYIYAGGTYLGRDNILNKLIDIFEQKSVNDVYAILDVYSNDTSNIKKSKCSRLHNSISYDDLLLAYTESDVALHVESFDEYNRTTTRLSFSTKIVDCLQSGNAILAICPSDNAGFKYLENENAAVCIDSDDKDEIMKGIELIEKDYVNMQFNARKCVISKHDPKVNCQMLEEAFSSLVKSNIE